MNRTTYEVIMSTDGTHKVTVTVEDPGGIDAALAYAQGTYAKLMQPGRLPLAEPVGEAPPQCGVIASRWSSFRERKARFGAVIRRTSTGLGAATNRCYRPLQSSP